MHHRDGKSLNCMTGGVLLFSCEDLFHLHIFKALAGTVVTFDSLLTNLHNYAD